MSGDRLAEIKARWANKPEALDVSKAWALVDVRWLVAEVERLRAVTLFCSWCLTARLPNPEEAVTVMDGDALCHRHRKRPLEESLAEEAAQAARERGGEGQGER